MSQGAKIVDGFDRQFAFVAVQGLGGGTMTLGVRRGRSEIKESAEPAAVSRCWTRPTAGPRRAGRPKSPWFPRDSWTRSLWPD